MASQFAGATIVGLFPMLRAISKAEGPEGNRALREVAKGLAAEVAGDAVSRATTPQERLAAAKGIKAASDRIPSIRMGGNARLSRSTPGRGKQPRAGDVIFGADFGSDVLRQFPPKVRGGRLVFQAVKDNNQEIAKRYLDAVEELFES